MTTGREDAQDPVRTIRSGAFFTVPDPLPRGRHGLDRDEVVRSQRERILIAATELLATHGFAAMSTRAICGRAGASLSAFYESFSGKEECVFAGYDRFIQVLIERLLAFEDTGVTWEEYVHTIVSGYFDVLREDPVVARAFQVEMDALGAEARRRRREALTGLAAIVQGIHVERDPASAADRPLEAYVAAVYGIRQIACDAIDSGDEHLADVDVEGRPWVLRLFT
ncbi:TetR/AcrR family transcriptional regulator [Nocardioides sp. R-C-SC26]|uniref:TetR/AcrR family transcriptional regulator n=1 Tax=Nocardioides sp. R-C-SC26 TaxID=2870414 RepID=UPI001E47F5FC|nr:TetR/AcrR family transcriptional regulator [Nocardioides sp. R-C-SC26]